MPLVPEASSGGCGVLSQTSTPAVSEPRKVDVVIVQVNQLDVGL